MLKDHSINKGKYQWLISGNWICDTDGLKAKIFWKMWFWKLNLKISRDWMNDCQINENSCAIEIKHLPPYPTYVSCNYLWSICSLFKWFAKELLHQVLFDFMTVWCSPGVGDMLWMCCRVFTNCLGSVSVPRASALHNQEGDTLCDKDLA